MDHLQVIFGFLGSDDLRACASVCRMWRIGSAAERRRRTRKLAETAFEWMDANPGELVLAGSLATWLVTGEPTHWFPNDADLFLYGAASEHAERDYLCEKGISCGETSFTFLYNTPVHTEHVKHYNGPRPLVATHATPAGNVQFILSSEFPTASSVLDSFDVSCCMVGFTARDECIKGRMFSVLPVSAFHWMTAPNTYIEDKLIAFQSERTSARARKYEARGFTLDPVPAVASLQQMRFGILYSFVHPSTYRPSGCMILQCIIEERDKTRLACNCAKGCLVSEGNTFRNGY